MRVMTDMQTPIASDNGDEEHAVIAHFRLAAEGFDDANQRRQVCEAERVMAATTKESGVGEVDGNGFGGGKAVLYAYGPDADTLLRVMEPTLRSLPVRPARAVLRRGDIESCPDL